jgi:hypothetical protein
MQIKTKTRGGKAIRALQQAYRWDTMPALDYSQEISYKCKADLARKEAEAMLQPTGELVSGAGEMIHVDPEDQSLSLEVFADTLENPTLIAVDASHQRIQAAAEAGVLELSTDAAQSAGAKNSLEKMLCHQMAAAHHAMMRLIKLAIEDEVPRAEVVRLTNGAARLSDVYQKGLLTLHRIRTGGRQTVMVQHVNVSGDARAVIAGNVKSAKREDRNDEGDIK